MTGPRLNSWRRFGIAACLALPMIVLTACGNEEARFPNRDNFTAAASDYLAQRGHVCLAKYDWPIKVATGSNAPDAQQMPLLEKLGFVTGKDVAAAREYALTDTGRFPGLTILPIAPLLARAIQREGTMQMRLGVHLTRRGWVADELDLH